MKATLATTATGSPAQRSAASAATPRLASMIGNRATRDALAGPNALTRPPLPSTVRVQLARSAGRTPTARLSHPARANGGEHGDAAIRAAARGVASSFTIHADSSYAGCAMMDWRTGARVVSDAHTSSVPFSRHATSTRFIRSRSMRRAAICES